VIDSSQFQIKRRSEVLHQFGYSRSVFYDRINSGLMPPPISLGSRAVGYLAHELDAVLSYMVAGKDNKEIKSLVKQLVDDRKNVLTTSGGENHE